MSDVDRALVEAASRGDREAFDELVRRHQAAIVGLARVLAGRTEEPEDLAQEVFVRAWKSLSTFRGDSSFRTWLHHVAVNVVRSHHSKRSTLMRMIKPATDDDPEPVADTESVEQSLTRRDAIEHALAILPPELREAVTLRDLQGLDYKDIADMLGVPIGTIESRIFRGRQRLRPLLASLVKTS
jgi:RNA polymerase sigma-70 factor (ECF subfamily)